MKTGLLILLALAAAPAKTVYDVPLTFRADSGGQTSLAQLRGKPVVLAMVYTYCNATCPITVSRLKSVQAALDQRGAKADFVLVSLDPARDTPEAVARFKARHGLARPNWHVLVGTPADTRTLAMLLGFRYSQNPDTGEVVHENKLFLLDATGKLLEVVPELNAELAPLIDKVPGPT